LATPPCPYFLNLQYFYTKALYFFHPMRYTYSEEEERRIHLMSTFNRFLGKVGRGFKKVGDKMEDMGDNAAASVRAKALQIRIEEQYELLGEVVYRDLHCEESLEEKKLELIASIDALFDELETIKEQKAERKAKQEAAKAEKAAAKAAEAEQACAEQPAEEAAKEAAGEEAAEATEAEVEKSDAE
jgi:hypothetical protein